MDCCNYMQYRHHQPYYGSQYYDPVYHPGEYYGQQMYPDYYGNNPYYPQHWQCAVSFPDYVYNPKEARIRKAMREATRDRSIGVSPMLPRPSARRVAHGWAGTHEEHMMMPTPLASAGGGMRGGLESPVCFPISNGTGSSQFMPPMNNGYSKLDASMPAAAANSLHSNYMQPNPLAQLQHQTEMWHNYHQDSMRSRSTGNSYMMQEVGYHHPHHHQQQAIDMSNVHIRQSHSVSSSTMSMTPPHTNENVPPDELAPPPPPLLQAEAFESKHIIEPLMESNSPQHSESSSYSAYHSNVEFSAKSKKGVATATTTQNRKKSPSTKPLPDFNEAFGSTERGRFQSPPDPRLAPSIDYFFDNSDSIKFDDYQI